VGAALTGTRITHADWVAAMDDAARNALDGTAYGRPLRELARELIAHSAAGLRGGAACAGSSADPAQFLAPLATTLGIDLARSAE